MDIEWDKWPKWLNEEKIYGLTYVELTNDQKQMVLQTLSSTSSKGDQSNWTLRQWFLKKNPHFTLAQPEDLMTNLMLIQQVKGLNIRLF